MRIHLIRTWYIPSLITPSNSNMPHQYFTNTWYRHATHNHSFLLGVSTGRVGLGLCPTRTRPKCGGWIKNWLETDLEIWLDFSVRVSSVSSWFRSVSGLSPGTKSGRNLTGSFDIWLKYGWICRDRTEIWPDPSRSGLDFVG